MTMWYFLYMCLKRLALLAHWMWHLIQRFKSSSDVILFSEACNYSLFLEILHPWLFLLYLYVLDCNFYLCLSEDREVGIHFKSLISISINSFFFLYSTIFIFIQVQGDIKIQEYQWKQEQNLMNSVSVKNVQNNILFRVGNWTIFKTFNFQTVNDFTIFKLIDQFNQLKPALTSNDNNWLKQELNGNAITNKSEHKHKYPADQFRVNFCLFFFFKLSSLHNDYYNLFYLICHLHHHSQYTSTVFTGIEFILIDNVLPNLGKIHWPPSAVPRVQQHQRPHQQQQRRLVRSEGMQISRILIIISIDSFGLSIELPSFNLGVLHLRETISSNYITPPNVLALCLVFRNEFNHRRSLTHRITFISSAFHIRVP